MAIAGPMVNRPKERTARAKARERTTKVREKRKASLRLVATFVVDHIRLGNVRKVGAQTRLELTTIRTQHQR